MKICGSITGEEYPSSDPRGLQDHTFVWDIFENCHCCSPCTGRNSLKNHRTLAGIGTVGSLAPVQQGTSARVLSRTLMLRHTLTCLLAESGPI